MSNVIKVVYQSGKKLDGTIYSPDGLSIWNLTTGEWDSVDTISGSWTDYAIAFEEGGSTGMYTGEIPSNLPPNTLGEKYAIVISVRSDDSTPSEADLDLGGRDFYWTGSGINDEVTITIQSLSTVDQADAFFGQLLYTSTWTDADADTKQRALNQATMAINRLPYKGSKTVEDQPNEFPRTGIYLNKIVLNSTTVPNDVIVAQYYEAFELIQGVSLEKERRSMRAVSKGLSSVRTTYDPTLVPEHLQAGLVSAVAWDYLSPYVNKDNVSVLRLRRVS